MSRCSVVLTCEANDSAYCYLCQKSGGLWSQLGKPAHTVVEVFCSTAHRSRLGAVSKGASVRIGNVGCGAVQTIAVIGFGFAARLLVGVKWQQ